MTQEEALHWFADLFGLPSASITPQSKRSEIPAWDSLGVLMLMGGLDETFQVVINDDDMRALKTVGDVLDLLQARGKLR